jgi:hypothetical protein
MCAGSGWIGSGGPGSLRAGPSDLDDICAASLLRDTYPQRLTCLVEQGNETRGPISHATGRVLTVRASVATRRAGRLAV